MKKIFLLIGLSVLSFATFAEKVPTVIVNKSNGGWTAILNLYNYVNYTPGELTPTGVGQLDCCGAGFIACRLPNTGQAMVNVGNSVVTVTDANKLSAFKTAINDVIEQYENAQTQANNTATATVTSQPLCKKVPSSYTKTIAFQSEEKGNGAKKKGSTYVVRGVVTSSNGGNSTMKIYIEQVNLLSMLGGN